MNASDSQIAVVGFGCRFPQAATSDAFWQLLRQGRHGITTTPTQRWGSGASSHDDSSISAATTSQWGGFLNDIDEWDPDFFGIAGTEASHMDPQQRVLLEVAWEALEHAGIVPDTLARSRTGVFIGITNNDYRRLVYQDPAQMGPFSGTGTHCSMAACRLSYVLNLQGPSLAIDTACSSSLVAFHYACQSLLTQEAHLCLVGVA